MNIKKSLLVAGAATTIGVAGLSGLGVASAATNSNGEDGLVSKIATTFNLKEADVQAVFDEEKAERNAERQAELADRLQDAVDDGDITAEQKTLIENKLKELQTAREAEHNELETWAKEHEVDLAYVMAPRKVAFSGNEKIAPASDRLQEAVEDGDITADQKAAIEDKQKELQAKREADHEALKKWAEDNNIDIRHLMMGGLMLHARGSGGPMGSGGAL